MAKQIYMVRMGQTMKEGTIVVWLKKEGENVRKGDGLYEMAYDKATTTVEAKYDGILHILVEEGETVPVSTVVGVLLEDGEQFDSNDNNKLNESDDSKTEKSSSIERKDRSTEKTPLASPAAKRMIQEKGLDILKIQPKGTIIQKSDVEDYLLNQRKSTSTPLAKKIASELGININEIESEKRIYSKDVLSFVKTEDLNKESEETQCKEEVNQMTPMRKAIARNMLNSHMTSPTVTFNISVEMTEMKKCREQLKSIGISVSYTDLLVKFAAKVLTEFPALNCSVEDNKIIYKKYVNVGVAVALENGLVVPCIADADKKSLTEISTEVKELAALARENKLPPEKLSGGTFTITNLGMYGIESFTPIINQPEVAILGVNAMEDRVVVRDGEAVIRTMMTLSLTADHRVIDGAVAAKFLQRLRNLIEKPVLFIA